MDADEGEISAKAVVLNDFLMSAGNKNGPVASPGDGIEPVGRTARQAGRKAKDEKKPS
jgi:hypothetical protein